MNLDEGDSVSAYLCMAGTSSLPARWEVNVIFNFFLYNYISDNYRCFRGKARRFNAINSKCGFSKLISKDSLRDACNGYIFEDNCVFGAEVFVVEKQPLVEKLCVHNLSDAYKREWKISEFSKLKEIWKSEEFFAGGYNWKVMIYLNGYGSGCSSHVSIYLKCVDAESFGCGKKVNAECLFCLRNQLELDDKKHHSMPLGVNKWFKCSHRSWGIPKFKAIGDMHDPSKGFLVDDCCTLEIQLSVKALQIMTT